MTFGEIVKKHLTKAGLTQRWLADQVGVSPSGLQSMFRNPTLETVKRIDAVLPIPEAAGLLHTGNRIANYVGNENLSSVEILTQLESLTLAYQDVLNDPDAREDFAALIEAILELSPKQRRGLLHLIQSSDKQTK